MMILERDGEAMSVKDWAARLGVGPIAIYQRIKRYQGDLALVLAERPRRPRQTKRILICGQLRTRTEWEALLGVTLHTIHSRVRRGLPEERVLHKGHFPGHSGTPLTCHGQTMSMSQWARHLGISRQRVHQRLKRFPIGEALSRMRHTRTRGKGRKNVTHD